MVFNHLLAVEGVAHLASADSCGLAGWHVGDRMDSRSATHLTQAGYQPEAQRASQFHPGWWGSHDLMLAMDGGHLSDLRDLAPADFPPEALRLFGDFDPSAPGSDVPDPYYGGDAGFAAVLTTIERTCGEIIRQLKEGT